MGKATQDLRKEHDSILHVLSILDRILADNSKEASPKIEYFNEVVYFLKIFADKCHHGKEENHLFIELVEKGIPKEGGPIGVMLQEHEMGRGYISQMAQALEAKNLSDFGAAAINYRDLLRLHIEKENNALFVMADDLISEQEQDELFEKFEKHEEEVIGHGVHEELHSMIHKWTKEFLR